MGKQNREKSRALRRETHEPREPHNWPLGHVEVELTGSESDECLRITIHGVKHYLHATTARELSNMLLARLEEWNAIAEAAGFEPV